MSALTLVLLRSEREAAVVLFSSLDLSEVLDILFSDLFGE